MKNERFYESRELTGHYIPGDPGIASDKASIGSTWEIFCQKTGNRFYSFSDSTLKCIDCFIVTSSSWAVARASRTKPVNWCYVWFDKKYFVLKQFGRFVYRGSRAPDPVTLRENRALAAVLLGYPFCWLLLLGLLPTQIGQHTLPTSLFQHRDLILLVSLLGVFWRLPMTCFPRSAPLSWDSNSTKTKLGPDSLDKKLLLSESQRSPKYEKEHKSLWFGPRHKLIVCNVLTTLTINTPMQRSVVGLVGWGDSGQCVNNDHLKELFSGPQPSVCENNLILY